MRKRILAGAVSLALALSFLAPCASAAADINLDGEFDPDDQLSDDINRYGLISGSSFYCGNLVPAAFKGVAGITLLSQTSGGGTCTVLPCTTGGGAVFAISGTRQISMVKNGSFYNVDLGVEQDFVLSRMESFYDREALVEYIHSLP